MKILRDDWQADDQARQTIREDLDNSLLVEAAAGTGKTTELVHRLVAVLARGLTTVDRIVAVTFTRKAAGELELRLRQRLDQERSECADATVRERLEQAIEHLEEAQIGTIHSFCAQLLRERPVEARVDPGFREVADDEGPRLYRRAFERWIQEQLERMPPGLRRALSRLALRRDFAGAAPLERLRTEGWNLVEWRMYPARWRRPEYDREQAIDLLAEEARKLARYYERCERANDPLRRALEPVGLFEIFLKRNVGLGEGRALEERDYDALEARLLELARQLNKTGRGGKGRGKFAEGLPREQVLATRDLFLEALELFRGNADADLASLLQEELWGSIEAYERLKEREGVLDFTDLLLRTRDLLRDDPAVRRDFTRRFSHIFIDEFQDTDSLQLEILLLLAAEDPSVADWRAARPVPGKLFLVGDPKQSIYRFRRADVRLYQEAKELLGKAGVRLVILQRSFRSNWAIQRFVNTAFAPEMDGDRQTGSPEYIALEGHLAPSAQQPAIVALPVPDPYGGWGRITNRQIDESLPVATADFCRWLLEESGWRVRDRDTDEERPMVSSDICLLFRRYMSWNRDVTRAYTRALEARGVPHLLIGARTFHQREEVETLRAALTAIEWPDDDLAVFATLRGALFSFPDDQLYRFHRQVPSWHLFEWRRAAGEDVEDLAPEIQEVGEVLDLLATLHRRRNRRAVVETVQELLAATRAQAAMALRPAGPQVLGNVERVCDLARAYELGGGNSFRGFVDQLNEEAEKPSSSQSPVVEEGAEGVRVMTVHNAKGLEFPVVVLADMTANMTRQQPERTVDPDNSSSASSILGCLPLDLRQAAEIELQRDRAESVRVAYVAATRARDLLVVPTLGDEQRSGWLQPLHRAIYPSTGERRRSTESVGCPTFGEASVRTRPPDHDGRPEGSVRPGRHIFRDAAYDVTWWDPCLLDLQRSANRGLAREELLVRDQEGVAASGSDRYQRWQREQQRTRERGVVASRDVHVVTQIDQDPPGGLRPVELLESRRELARPSGTRFGDLVHSVLRVVDYGAVGGAAVADLVALQGRQLGADADEMAAAKVALSAVLEHPVLAQARAAGAMWKEAPFVLPLEDGRLIEGTVDLVFQSDGLCTVVDFKTDIDLTARWEHTRRQVSWYLCALERLQDQPVRGVVLPV